MEHKKAIEVLLNLQKNQSLNPEEQEALSTAIGILGWTSLAKNRLKAQKEKREKDTQW